MTANGAGLRPTMWPGSGATVGCLAGSDSNGSRKTFEQQNPPQKPPSQLSHRLTLRAVLPGRWPRTATSRAFGTKRERLLQTVCLLENAFGMAPAPSGDALGHKTKQNNPALKAKA